MHPLTPTLLLLLALTSSSLSQRFFFPRQPPGCQYPSLFGDTHIYFDKPGDAFHYSISTPWTTYYPDTLRAALTLQGFIVSTPGKKTGAPCGWRKVETVKKHGWEHGAIHYRPVPGKSVHAAKPASAPRGNLTMQALPGPPSMHGNLTRQALPGPPSVHGIPGPTQEVLHASRKLHLPTGPHPPNETLALIRLILATNAPTPDILVTLAEIGLPILGLVGFAYALLLLMRYWTNRRYPQDEEDAIELSDRNPNPPAYDRAYERAWARAANVAHLKLFMPTPTLARQGTSTLDAPRPAPPRQSSSVYSRSMDGVTLYPKEDAPSWE